MSLSSAAWKQTAASYLTGERPAFATTLVGIVLKAYGAEAFDWDPLALDLQLQDDFQIERVERTSRLQLQALISAMSTDTIYYSVPVFDQTVNWLNRTPVAEMEDPPDVDDLAWAVAEIGLNDPEPPIAPGKDLPWSEDIRRYCGAVLNNEGIKGRPTVLSWAKGVLGFSGSDQVASENPEMFAAAFQLQAVGAEEIDQEVTDRLSALMMQLAELGIKVG